LRRRVFQALAKSGEMGEELMARLGRLAPARSILVSTLARDAQLRRKFLRIVISED
jgi:hypothetical protein